MRIVERGSSIEFRKIEVKSKFGYRLSEEFYKLRLEQQLSGPNPFEKKRQDQMSHFNNLITQQKEGIATSDN